MIEIIKAIDFGKARNKSILFGLLLLITCLVRLITWIPPVIDHDESTYLIIANQILKGDLPYVRLIDIKPVGIYFLFAAFLKLFGHHIFLVRIAATIAVAGTSYFLFSAKLRQNGDNISAILIAGLYVAAASLHKWTWTSNTELFFNLFIAIGLYYFLGKLRNIEMFLMGLMFGIAFMFKYVVLLDFFCFGLVFVIAFISKMQFKKFLWKTILACIGLIIPFCAVALLYYFNGQIEVFRQVTFEIPSRYSSSFSFGKSLKFALEFYASYFWLVPFYAISLHHIYKKGSKSNLQIKLLSVIWPLFAWVAILSTGKMFFHYSFQALIPFLFFIPDGISQIKVKQKGLNIVAACTIAMMVACPFLQYFTLFKKPDSINSAAEYLNNHMDPSDQIFVESQIILYFLTDKTPITQYVHPTLMIKPEHIIAYGIDPQGEMNKIYESAPKYWIADLNKPPLAPAFLSANYRQEIVIGNLLVYRRND
ncbi:MAG: glycosyltransferase family 39 protein [Saprospiraceae bacterium]